MPDLTFELPHWAYWAGLVLFPLIAMAMARRKVTIGEHERTLPIAYFVWLTGGILGFHRYYLRNIWGILYLPLFIAILYANGQEAQVREVVSEQTNIIRLAGKDIERAGSVLANADAEIAAAKAAVEAADPEGFGRKSAERKLQRIEKRVDDMRARDERARQNLVDAEPALEAATADRNFWSNVARYAFFGILAFLAVDALLIPWLAKRAREKVAGVEESGADEMLKEHGIGGSDITDHEHIGKGLPGLFDRMSYFFGEFASYWAVIAVFVYYYEVISRYVFNSPTNWAHEGMFLMFGMQYLIAGSYAMLTESHVRVDIFYSKFSTRRKALVDILTSIFFFIFAGVLLFTCYIFASDATRVNELSVTEWQIAYWPIKWMMVVGAVLLLGQGISKLLKDIHIFASGEDGAPPNSGEPKPMAEAA